MSNYIIGSFNLLKMDFKSNEETNKNFKRIANIIREEKFDIIALQEVIADSAVKQLIKNLNQWDYCFEPSKITASKDAQREGYAFLWKKRRFHLVDAPSAVEVKNEYRIRGKGGRAYVHQGHLVRPPLVVRLTPQGLYGGSNFEIRLINTHIAFSSPKNCEELYQGKDADIRKMEFDVLAQEIYRRVSKKRYGDNLPAYTFLLGDYNLCLAGGGSPKMEEFIIIDVKDTRPIPLRLRTVQKDKTSLKQPSRTYTTPDLNSEHDMDVVSEEDKAAKDYYSKNYDHFSYEEDLDEKMYLTAERVSALEKYYNNDLEGYRKEVSDHVPIKLTMNLRKR